MEVEAKFAVPDEKTFAALEAVEAVATCRVGPGRRRLLHDCYLDTADHRITRAGYFCRRRSSDDGTEMTLKSVGAAGDDGLREREELSVTVETDEGPAAWPQSEARELALRLTAGRPLEQLFVVRQHRLERSVSRDGPAVAEMALNRVTIETQGGDERFLECELELKGEGTERDLKELAGALKQRWTLDAERESKFELGLALAGR